LHLGETLPPRTSNKKLQGQSAVSMRHPTSQHLLEKQVTSLQELRPMCNFLQTHLKKPELFWFTSDAFLKRPILLTYWLLRPFSMRKSHVKAVPRKDYFTHLRSPAKSTSSVSNWILRSDVTSWAQPQEPQRWPRERDAEWSALTNVRHTHCAPRQLGTTANQRYDVPWDWLWVTCHMAGVRWGTHCVGFGSKEGPHYCFERSTRNPLKHDQVWTAFGNHPEAVIGQATINLIHEFGNPLRIPYLSCTGLLSGGLCHTRKLSLRIFVSKKGVICNHPTDVCIRNLWQKAERGKITGSESTTMFPQAPCFEKSTRSVPETWGQGYEKTGQEIRFMCSQERCKETSK
jgi:hypothetical protein